MRGQWSNDSGKQQMGTPPPLLSLEVATPETNHFVDAVIHIQ